MRLAINLTFCAEAASETIKKDGNKKEKKKVEKYISRLRDIVNGKNSKCPNTLANMIKIAEEFGKNGKSVINIYSHLEEFSFENQESLLHILDEMFQIESEPNPLSSTIGTNSENAKEWDTDTLIDKFSKESKSSSYAHLMKSLTTQPETHELFLNFEVLNKLIENIESGDAHISKNSN